MKLLLDECLPIRLRTHITGHDVYTVSYMGWIGIRNGNLLALAAADGFEAILTTDQGMEHEQNVSALPLAIMILHSNSNAITALTPLVPKVLAALANLQSKAITHIR